MASVGEILVEAEVATHETTVMYDHELLSEVKILTVEELYVRLDIELDKIDDPKGMRWGVVDLNPNKIYLLEKNHSLILCYLCELYRRNM